MRDDGRRVTEGFLATDMYQLTMSQVYFRQGIHDRLAQFDHFFRSYPDYGNHKAGYCINAGLEWLLDWMEAARCRDEDVDYLRGLKGQTGSRLFDDGFLTWLRENGNFDGVTVEAVPEGRAVHPNEPVTVVRGPLAMAQVMETTLLMHLNYQTLIATKASRIRHSARGQVLLEFGMRRAQDRGAHAGGRAAMIGGADFTSNVAMSKVLGYPPKGTHAHSLVQAFMALTGSELDAFRAYAEVYPDDCILLVDTVDTLESGMPNAIRVFEELRRKGHEPVGVRLDSGDLAYLAVQTARMLDEAGFPEAKIVLSNQLDELVVLQIVSQIEEEAPGYGVDPHRLVDRLVHGVGTRLITSAGDPALDGVYKLVGIHDGSEWKPAIKLSETPAKIPNPGGKQLWRLYDRRNMAVADLIGLKDEHPDELEEVTLRHPIEDTTYRRLPREEVSEFEPLLVEMFAGGSRSGEPPTIEELRRRRDEDLHRLDPGVKRIMNPHRYHVSLTEKLWSLKRGLISSTRNDA